MIFDVQVSNNIIVIIQINSSRIIFFFNSVLNRQNFVFYYKFNEILIANNKVLDYFYIKLLQTILRKAEIEAKRKKEEEEEKKREEQKKKIQVCYNT